jgi:hypothetical protein
MQLLTRVLRFIWAHRIVALLIAVAWNLVMYFVWRLERIPAGIPPWLPLVYAAFFALLIPAVIISGRRRRLRNSGSAK